MDIHHSSAISHWMAKDGKYLRLDANHAVHKRMNNFQLRSITFSFPIWNSFRMISVAFSYKLCVGH